VNYYISLQGNFGMKIKEMKKLSIGLVVLFALALTLSSCKSQQRCAAYSKVDVENMQKPS